MTELSVFKFGELVDTSCDDKVDRLEEKLLDMPQIVLPVEEYITNGMYARIMHIPAGVVATGSVSREAHFIALLKGDMSVMTENGVVRMKAPYFNISQAWIKRAGYAHEDSMFLTVHKTDKETYDEAEDDVFANEDELFNKWVTKCQEFGQQ